METANPVQSRAEKNLHAYFNNHDTSFVAEDAVYTNMATGEKIRGRQAVADFLHYLYNVAFEARATLNNIIITDEKAVLEANIIGKHIGEFAGIPATGKMIDVPACVTYDLNDDGMIQEARMYILTDVLMRQLKSD